MSQELVDAIANMKEEEALALSKKFLDEGGDPMNLLESCREGMDKVGQLFSEGKYFIPELMMAGEMLTQISDMTKSKISESATSGIEYDGKVLIGTVEGDIHDIGKSIVSFMLDVNGFEVIDLGVDVPPARFVEAIEENKPNVVGLCGLLTLAYDPMKATVEAINDAGLRDSVKIMIGGGAIDEEIKKYTGADAYGADAVSAVSITREWIGE